MYGFGGAINTTRRAAKVDGGFLVNGTGRFSTMCAAADYLFETARFDDPENGPVQVACSSASTGNLHWHQLSGAFAGIFASI
jgi:alkylation response protein AidB-like acyl-CoA dehydrogenase